VLSNQAALGLIAVPKDGEQNGDGTAERELYIKQDGMESTKGGG